MSTTERLQASVSLPTLAIALEATAFLNADKRWKADVRRISEHLRRQGKSAVVTRILE